MFVFALPALFALATKVWVYMLARKAKSTSHAFLWLLAFFAIHNLCEALVIAQLFNDAVSDGLLRLYYVAALFALAYMCIFTFSIASKDKHNQLNAFALIVASCLSGIIFMTDWLVAGASSAGYTVTAIKGTYYFVFQLTVILGFGCILYTLARRYLTSADLDVQLKCFYAALALSPIIVMSVIVIIMMHIGSPYTGAMLLPFTSSLFLLLVIATQSKHDLIRIRHKLPFSNQKKAEREILSVYRALADGDLGLVKAKHEIEKVLIQGALERSNNNVSLAANKLGIKRSSLYSIFNRLEMSRQKTTE